MQTNVNNACLLLAMSLENIWDEPVASNGDSSPHKRPRQSLFLSDSDSDHERPAKRAVPAPPSARPDVDALFEDLDKEEEDDDLRYKPLAPTLDLEKLAKEAEARHARARQTAPSQTQASSSKAGAAGSKDPSGKDDGKGKPGDGEKKGRKVLPKLDEERLVGPEGFPLLIEEIRGFKPKGKGNEVHSHSSRASYTHADHFPVSTRISIGCCRYTSSGLTKCIQRRHSKTRSTVLRNYATPSACRLDVRTR